jgi:hypothetical protein
VAFTASPDFVFAVSPDFAFVVSPDFARAFQGKDSGKFFLTSHKLSANLKIYKIFKLKNVTSSLE